MYITRLASKEIFSSLNKINWEVGQGNSLTAPQYSNLFCHKTVHVLGIFSAHHEEFSTVHSALVSFMQV